jgi:hypothetical protein
LRVWDRHAAKGDDELGAADRDDAIALELEFWTNERNLQCRSVTGIADQGIGQPVREWIHRTGDRHALRLKSPTPKILHGRQ